MPKLDKKKEIKKPTAPKVPPRPNIVFKTKNYILFFAGVLTIIVGFITLSKGSITLAPILLVVGYVILIPLSIIVK
ncbi:MAG: DUF3098 domain-containing protein [candidate division WOR-3 bacterium]|nr:DUF3098 domain-containing protein [candidate division WOR-3 bacterium]